MDDLNRVEFFLKAESPLPNSPERSADSHKRQKTPRSGPRDVNLSDVLNAPSLDLSIMPAEDPEIKKPEGA
jgi:hypothetical protein